MCTWSMQCVYMEHAVCVHGVCGVGIKRVASKTGQVDGRQEDTALVQSHQR